MPLLVMVRVSYTFAIRWSLPYKDSFCFHIDKCDSRSYGDLTTTNALIIYVVVKLHSFSSSFSLLTLLLFRLFPYWENVVLFSSYDLIVPWPLAGGDPGCHRREWPCAYPLDYFPAAWQPTCSLLLTFPFLCIWVPSLEGRIVAVPESSLASRF